MAKLAYSKLKIKKDTSVSIIQYKVDNETTLDIEVKKYLPVEDKLQLVSNVINNSMDNNKFYNVGKLDIFLTLEIIDFYTNLSFTDAKKEKFVELYDELISSGIYKKVVDILNENGEYTWLYYTVDKTVKSIYKYQNSVLGILDALQTDYSALGMDVNDLYEKLGNQENLALLRDVLTKLG